jgi:hypothetical protein
LMLMTMKRFDFEGWCRWRMWLLSAFDARAAIAQEAFRQEISVIRKVAIHQGQEESLCPSQSRRGGGLRRQVSDWDET